MATPEASARMTEPSVNAMSPRATTKWPSATVHDDTPGRARHVVALVVGVVNSMQVRLDPLSPSTNERAAHCAGGGRGVVVFAATVRVVDEVDAGGVVSMTPGWNSAAGSDEHDAPSTTVARAIETSHAPRANVTC